MIKKRTKLTPVCLALVLALAGTAACADIQQGIQAGEAEGSMQAAGRLAIEQAAGVKLADDLECTAGELSGTDTPIECSGQTADGRKASVNGTVTSAEPTKGRVKGRFTLALDGKKIADVDCVGVC